MNQIKISKTKPVEFTYEGLSKIKSLKELKSIMKVAMPSIPDEMLKQVKGKNKDLAIKTFLQNLNSNSDIDRFITPSSKSSPIKPVEIPIEKPKEDSKKISKIPKLSKKFTSQQATSEPIIQPPEDQTATTEPVKKQTQKQKKEIIEKKQHYTRKESNFLMKIEILF